MSYNDFLDPGPVEQYYTFVKEDEDEDVLGKQIHLQVSEAGSCKWGGEIAVSLYFMNIKDRELQYDFYFRNHNIKIINFWEPVSL